MMAPGWVEVRSHLPPEVVVVLVVCALAAGDEGNSTCKTQTGLWTRRRGRS